MKWPLNMPPFGHPFCFQNRLLRPMTVQEWPTTPSENWTAFLNLFSDFRLPFCYLFGCQFVTFGFQLGSSISFFHPNCVFHGSLVKPMKNNKNGTPKPPKNNSTSPKTASKMQLLGIQNCIIILERFWRRLASQNASLLAPFLLPKSTFATHDCPRVAYNSFRTLDCFVESIF